MANPLSLKDIADFKIPASGLIDDSDTAFSYYKSGDVTLYDRSYIQSTNANRTWFFPADNVLIERSTDGGATWTTVPTSGTNSVNNDRRKELFAEIQTNSIALGPSGTQTTNMQLRITMKYNGAWYCSIDRAHMWFSNSGHSCEVKMDASTYGAQSTYNDIFGWRSISGWSGNNVYKFPYKTAWGSNNANHLYNVRFTFKYLSINSSYATTPAYIKTIALYGVNKWNSSVEPSNNGHLYKWDMNKNVTFPAHVYYSPDYADGDWHKVGMTRITAEQTSDIVVNIPSEMQSGVWDFKAEATFEERTNSVAGNYWIQMKAVTSDNAYSAVNNTRWYNQGTGGAGVTTEVWQSNDSWNGCEVLAQQSSASFTMEANWSKCGDTWWNFKSTAGGVYAGNNNSATYLAGGRIKTNKPIINIRLSCIQQPSGGVLWFKPGSRLTVYARKIA